MAKPHALLADKEYDYDAIREDLLWRGILPIIPSMTSRGKPPLCDFRRYRDCNHVERLSNRSNPDASQRGTTKPLPLSLAFSRSPPPSSGSMISSTGPRSPRHYVGVVDQLVHEVILPRAVTGVLTAPVMAKYWRLPGKGTSPMTQVLGEDVVAGAVPATFH